MRISIFFLFCMLFLKLTGYAEAIDGKYGQVLLDRIVLLYEITGLKNFETSEKGMLDAIVRRVFPHDSSPAALLIQHKRNDPELFTENNAVYDVALRKDIAVEISRHFVGRAAKLEDEEGKYLYSNAVIAPRWCRARLEGVDSLSKDRMRLRGALLCEKTSESPLYRKGDMDVEIERLDTAPLGWAVNRFFIHVF